MNWLNKVVDELIERHGDKEIVVSSGVSPSGPYHVGTLREVMTAEAISREIKRRGRLAKHLHVSDDLDVFRKVPSGLPDNFSEYLGRPLCDVPAPEGDGNYADYFIQDLFTEGAKLQLGMDVVRAHEKYREGYFVDAIEKALVQKEKIKEILESISGHKVDDNWSPVQVIEDGYLKNRPVIDFDTSAKTLNFKDKDGSPREISYASGEVKLNWRIDWPARWALMDVDAEPFGRDHATKGGSYDTGAVIVKEIYGKDAPLPLPYNFINRTGDTKKMSKSAGDVITVGGILEVLPPEVVWFFMLRYCPEKQLFFDEGQTLIRLIDEFGELLAKSDKTDSDKQLLELCLVGIDTQTISRVPFSHLMTSYQAALKPLRLSVAPNTQKLP
jgi:lysyl-tRNA synthetase class 1